MTNDNNALLHSGFLLADLVFFHKGQNQPFNYPSELPQLKLSVFS